MAARSLNMSSTLGYIIAVLAVTAMGHADPKPHNKHDRNHTCQDFTHGLSFNDTQAIGIWHLLHYKTETANGSGDSHCVQFSSVTDQDRKDLTQLIGKFVENLKWEDLSLKMQIPCANLHPNKTRDYYLEKLEEDGSYRTLQMPPSTAKLDLSEFHRYPMRLKIIEGQYLGMMDCHEKFVFLLGKQPPEGKEIDERLKQMIDIYWPEEFA